jgi:hypothetical protein
MKFNVNGSEIMRIASIGRVGINTTRLTLKTNYGDGNTGGFCIDSAVVTSTYNLRIFSYVQAGGQVVYYFQVNNIAPGVSISSSVNAC